MFCTTLSFLHANSPNAGCEPAGVQAGHQGGVHQGDQPGAQGGVPQGAKGGLRAGRYY